MLQVCLHAFTANSLAAKIQYILEERFRDRVNQCLDILDAVSPKDDRGILIRKKGKRVAGTFEWIKEDNTYQAWRRGDQRILWIRGGPGKGKTVLSVFLTEELEKNCDLVYFFCTAQDQKRDNAAAVVKGLLWQLVHERRNLAEVLADHLVTANVSQATGLSLEAVWDVFVDTVCHDQAPKTITCVLDGLDECDAESRSWLVEKLSGPISHKRSGVQYHLQLAIVSRDTHEVRRVASVSMDLDRPETNRADIKRFVSTRLSEFQHLPGVDDAFLHAIEKKMLERATDTFLWIGYAMMELTKKTTRSEVEKTLQELPQGLEALYTRMLRQISPDHRRTSAQILRWVALAVQPLSLKMLATAIGTKSTELLSVQQVLRDQIEHCSPLVVIRHEDNTARLVHESARDYLLAGRTKGDETLVDFHFSKEEEHLRSASFCLASLSSLHRLAQRLEKNPQRRAEIQESKQRRRSQRAHVLGRHQWLIRETRLEQKKYLEQKQWLERKEWLEGAQELGEKEWLEKKQSLEESHRVQRTHWVEEEQQLEEEQRLEQAEQLEQDKQLESIVYPLGFRAVLASGCAQETEDFLWYAIMHWPAHARDANSRAPRLEKSHPEFFRSDSEVRRKWFHAYHWNTWAQYSEASWTALHVACYLGINTLAQSLLSNNGKARANEKGYLGNTALHWAAAGGHQKIVKLLLDNGSDVRAESDNKKTALHTAVEHGHISIVELLLQHLDDEVQAAAEARDADGRTALHYAAAFGRETILRLLIVENRTCLDTRDKFGWTALHLAAKRNHGLVVATLLRYGANVHVQDGWQTTAMSYTGDAEIRQNLEEFGAERPEVYCRLSLDPSAYRS